MEQNQTLPDLVVGKTYNFRDGKYIITRAQSLNGKKYFCRCKLDEDGRQLTESGQWLEKGENSFLGLNPANAEDLKIEEQLFALSSKKEVKEVKPTPKNSKLYDKIVKATNKDLIKGVVIGAGLYALSPILVPFLFGTDIGCIACLAFAGYMGYNFFKGKSYNNSNKSK